MLKRVILFLSMIFCVSGVLGAEKHKFTLVIDAGHGGKDSGAKGKGKIYEKHINLNVALAFGRYVEKNCPDVRVIYTRKTDVFIPLHQRADIANKNKADVFISIHTNAIAGKGTPTGLETYTMGLRRSGEKFSAALRENEAILVEDDFEKHYSGFDPRIPESYIIFDIIHGDNMEASVELAKMIQKNVCATAGRPNKGVKQDAFLVLRETSMPACLIELGYITTASDEAYLTNSKNVDALGRGIYQAFLEFKRKHDGSSIAAPQKETPKVKEEPKQEKEEPKVVKEEPKQVKEEPKVVKDEPKVAKEEPKVAKEEPKVAKEEAQPVKEEAAKDGLPVFKVQFMGVGNKLKAGDKRFKGLKDVDCYKDGNLWKYTVGASTNLREIQTLRREVAKLFPEAFIVAFRDGVRMDINEAREEYNKRVKK